MVGVIDKESLTDSALHLLRLVPDGYTPLPHQVGGHRHIDGKLGTPVTKHMYTCTTVLGTPIGYTCNHTLRFLLPVFLILWNVRHVHVHVFEVFIIKLIIKEGICTLYYTDTSVQFIEYLNCITLTTVLHWIAIIRSVFVFVLYDIVEL